MASRGGAAPRGDVAALSAALVDALEPPLDPAQKADLLAAVRSLVGAAGGSGGGEGKGDDDGKTATDAADVKRLLDSAAASSGGVAELLSAAKTIRETHSSVWSPECAKHFRDLLVARRLAAAKAEEGPQMEGLAVGDLHSEYEKAGEARGGGGWGRSGRTAAGGRGQGSSLCVATLCRRDLLGLVACGMCCTTHTHTRTSSQVSGPPSEPS